MNPTFLDLICFPFLPFRYVAGGLVTLGVMVVVIAIQMIPVLAQDYIQTVLPISDMIYHMCEALYTGFTIEIVR